MTPQSFKQPSPVRSSASLLIGVATLATVVLATMLNGQSPAPKASWPTKFKPHRAAPIKLIQKGSDGKPFIYRTQHFELRSSTPLSEHNLSKFATTAESVPAVLTRLPLPLLSMPQDKTGKPSLAKVLIYPDEATFLEAGGVIGAAGYYNGWKQAIMLRADTFLNPPPPAGSKLPPKANYDLLVHEFTHLCMHRDLAYLPVWFTEGTAEYLAATHENKGIYQFTNITSLISRHIKRCLPLDKAEIVLPGIVETMSLTHQSWQQRIKHNPVEDNYRPYATSLLLVHSLFHGGEKRRNNTKTFLENIRKRQPLLEQVEILIPAAEREALQKKIVTYWKGRGLRIKFLPTPAPPAAE